MYSVRNVIVWNAKESHAQTSDPFSLRNDRHVADGPPRRLGCIYLATVLAETLNPGLESSAWILRWPQSRLSAAMHRIRVLSSSGIGRRPGRRVRRERQRQYVRQPSRCQRSTVSGFTMGTELCQPRNHRQARIQKRRCASLMRGRGWRRSGPTAVAGGKDYPQLATSLAA